MSRLTHSFAHKWGKWGECTSSSPSWTKMLNISRTTPSFFAKLWTYVILRKYYLKHFVTTKFKIRSICTCTNCNIWMPPIISWPSFRRKKKSVPSSVSTSLHGMKSQLKLGIYRQENYRSNLATREIPFLIVSKSAVGETISETLLIYFSRYFSVASRCRKNELSRQIQNFMMS